MNFFRENPFLSGILLVAVVVVGAAGYFASQSHSLLQETKELYSQRVGQLHALQNRAPYPSQENLLRITEEVEQFKASLVDFEAALAKMNPPLREDVTPQFFQDELRKVVSELSRSAAATNVQLPANFYLGFDEYRTALPSQEAAPALLRQMEVLDGIVKKIIEAGVARIDAFVRHPLPSEKQEATPAAESEQAPVVVKANLDLSFTGDQVRLRRVLNELVRAPQFTILRSLELENSAKAPPLRPTGEESAGVTGGATTQASELASLFQGAQDASAEDRLEILLGRETVTAKVRLELLDFSPLNLTGE